MPPRADSASSDYSDEDGPSPSKPRPLSFIASPRGEVIDTSPTFKESLASRAQPDRRPPRDTLSPTASYENTPPRNGSRIATPPMQRHGSDSTATSSFPLNDIDYESDPVAVAQELSNLQAIRRMSMDIIPMDPDLPSFDSGFRVPPVAPSHNADEEDPSRLFWVPARLHPELAPREFKTFIQERAKTIRRSSLSQQALAQDGSGSLRRRKSMLSRQIDEDGAERLDRRDSSSRPPLPAIQLDELANDPSGLVRRMSTDRASLESGADGPGDMPILPAKPGGQTLKRSTRTQYRRGSLKKPGMVGRRQTLRNSEEPELAPVSASGAPQLPIPDLPDLEFSSGTFGLTRVNTDPTPTTKSIENFSRPVRRAQTPPTDPKSWAGFDDVQTSEKPHSRRANGRRPTSPPQLPHPIPEIVVQPDARTSPPTSSDGKPVHMPVKAPERTSSMEHPSPPPQAPLPRPLANRPAARPQSQPARTGNSRALNVTLDDITAQPAMVPGNSNRTGSLSVIPTYVEEKKPDKKKSKESKSSWAWFSGGSTDDKEREKREKEELAKKNKSKLQKPTEKHETARLDVLQSSIDGTRGRESGVFDRQSLSVDDAKRSGKPSAESKKENSSIFSQLFSSSKRKSDKEAGGGKKGSSLRGLSPDPGPKLMRPDIDYHWTRFGIQDERAIYRLAHIKLANPRRELYSQVLLSNFMYSYLAKVQQMHPQIQIPQSAAQKQAQRQERQAQAKAQEEERKAQQQQERQAAGQSQSAQSPEELAQYQRYQEVRLSSNQVRANRSSSSPAQRCSNPSTLRRQKTNSGSTSRSSTRGPRPCSISTSINSTVSSMRNSQISTALRTSLPTMLPTMRPSNSSSNNTSTSSIQISSTMGNINGITNKRRRMGSSSSGSSPRRRSTPAAAGARAVSGEDFASFWIGRAGHRSRVTDATS